MRKIRTTLAITAAATLPFGVVACGDDDNDDDPVDEPADTGDTGGTEDTGAVETMPEDTGTEDTGG